MFHPGEANDFGLRSFEHRRGASHLYSTSSSSQDDMCVEPVVQISVVGLTFFLNLKCCRKVDKRTGQARNYEQLCLRHRASTARRFDSCALRKEERMTAGRGHVSHVSID